jgi:hypothetical protein
MINNESTCNLCKDPAHIKCSQCFNNLCQCHADNLICGGNLDLESELIDHMPMGPHKQMEGDDKNWDNLKKVFKIN